MPRWLLGGLWWLLACDAGAVTPLEPPAPVTGDAARRLVFETELGTVHCKLFPERAPGAVALVTGLAAGTARFRDARTGAVRTGRFYDGLTFFRRTAGAMVQVGCPLGTGTGHPGYRIEAELHPDDAKLLAEPGALVMARYHPAPNRVDPNPPPPGHVIGSQLVITLRPMPHLAGELPVIGRCADLDVVRRLSLAAEPPVLRRLEVGVSGAR
jgi:peptidyl-prolyl cis-trans isomerase A (cyclophilin A)